MPGLKPLLRWCINAGLNETKQLIGNWSSVVAARVFKQGVLVDRQRPMKNIVLDSTAILRSELGEQSKLARAARGLPLTYSREFTNAVTQDGWRCFVRRWSRCNIIPSSPTEKCRHSWMPCDSRKTRPPNAGVYNPMRLPERGAIGAVWSEINWETRTRIIRAGIPR